MIKWIKYSQLIKSYWNDTSHIVLSILTYNMRNQIIFDLKLK